MRDKIKTHYTVTIPAKWVPALHTLANKEHMTVTEVIVGALGEELARAEEEQKCAEAVAKINGIGARIFEHPEDYTNE